MGFLWVAAAAETAESRQALEIQKRNRCESDENKDNEIPFERKILGYLETDIFLKAS